VGKLPFKPVAFLPEKQHDVKSWGFELTKAPCHIFFTIGNAGEFSLICAKLLCFKIMCSLFSLGQYFLLCLYIFVFHEDMKKFEFGGVDTLDKCLVFKLINLSYFSFFHVFCVYFLGSLLVFCVLFSYDYFSFLGSLYRKLYRKMEVYKVVCLDHSPVRASPLTQRIVCLTQRDIAIALQLKDLSPNER